MIKISTTSRLRSSFPTRSTSLLRLLLSLVLLLSATLNAYANQENTNLKAISSATESVVKNSNATHRSPNNIARNQYRHPADTLAFFGLKADRFWHRY